VSPCAGCSFEIADNSEVSALHGCAATPWGSAPSNGVGVSEPSWRFPDRPMQDAPFFLASAEHTIINAQGCSLHIKVAGDHDRVHYEALGGGVISFSRIIL
jgi:hypothetical protein